MDRAARLEDWLLPQDQGPSAIEPVLGVLAPFEGLVIGALQVLLEDVDGDDVHGPVPIPGAESASHRGPDRPTDDATAHASFLAQIQPDRVDLDQRCEVQPPTVSDAAPADDRCRR